MSAILPKLSHAWLLALLAVASLPAHSQRCSQSDLDALARLDKMSRGLHEQSYHGVVIMHQREGWQSVQVSHVVDGDRAAESLTRLTGQGAEVTRVDHPLHCVHPGHRLLRRGGDAGADDCGIAEYYRLSMWPGERIAGHRTVLVRAKPRDRYRLGYLLSLDAETGLLLRSDTFDVDGKHIERVQFTKLSYEQSEPGSVPVDVRHMAEHPEPVPGSGEGQVPRPWAVTWVPDGFVPTDSTALTGSRRTYTDGLAVFSVFLESARIGPGEGIARNGSTLSYSRGMILDGQGVLVTVIGELPDGTARMVADRVAWVQ